MTKNSTSAVEEDLTLDDLEALILLDDTLSDEMRRRYIELIERLRAQLERLSGRS